MEFPTLNIFLNGAFMMALLVCGLAFAGFWRQTRDRLFGIFAIAFWMLAVERIPLVFEHKMREPETLVYLIRLAAFLLIIVGIIYKNRPTTKTN